MNIVGLKVSSADACPDLVFARAASWGPQSSDAVIPAGDRQMISEISSFSCNDFQGLRMPTVLYYVLCLTSVSGFESHSLR